MNFKDLEKIKNLEHKPFAHNGTDHIVPDDEVLICRVDGNCFSRYTSFLEKPFDLIFSNAMINTMTDLMKKFNADVGFTFSDEISLVFYPTFVDDKCIKRSFNGRVLKLTSLLAAYASVRFNYWMIFISNEKSNYTPQIKALIEKQEAIFDARIMSSDNTQLKQYLEYRQADCERNAIHALARFHFSSKQLHGKNKKEQIIMLAECGVDYYSTPKEYRLPTFCKWDIMEKEAIDQITLESVIVSRRYLTSFNPSNFDELLQKLKDTDIKTKTL